jgi:hypothetical protein
VPSVEYTGPSLTWTSGTSDPNERVERSSSTGTHLVYGQPKSSLRGPQDSLSLLRTILTAKTAMVHQMRVVEVANQRDVSEDYVSRGGSPKAKEKSYSLHIC